jgi:hypothetical protein
MKPIWLEQARLTSFGGHPKIYDAEAIDAVMKSRADPVIGQR